MRFVMLLVLLTAISPPAGIKERLQTPITENGITFGNWGDSCWYSDPVHGSGGGGDGNWVR